MKNALFLFIILIIFAELFLRLYFGLGNTVLFTANSNYEYIAQPQSLTRFGNKIYYNSYSQRNREITPEDSVAVFLIGDSVLNGGVQVPNDSLASTLLSNFYSKVNSKPVMALNISAGSWGPDNAFGYLKEYGNFNASKIVLVVSSHDAYDNMGFRPIVGIHPSYPDKQPFSALSELIFRYLPRYLPSLDDSKIDKDKILGINKKDESNSTFNKGFQNIYYYCIENDIDLYIYLHAEKSELKSNVYNEQGEEIIAFCQDRNIQLIRELDFMFPENAYLDNIHLNSYGQRLMYEVLKSSI